MPTPIRLRARRANFADLLREHGREISLRIDRGIEFVRGSVDSDSHERAMQVQARLEAWKPYADLVRVSAIDLMLKRFRVLRMGATGPISRADAELRLLASVIACARKYLSNVKYRAPYGAVRADRQKAIAAINKLDALRTVGCVIGYESADEKLSELLRQLKWSMQQRKRRSETTSRERSCLDEFAAAVQSAFRIDPAASVPLLAYFAEALDVKADVRSLGRYADVALPPFDGEYFHVFGRKRQKLKR